MKHLSETVDNHFRKWVSEHLLSKDVNLISDARKCMTPDMANLAVTQIEVRRKAAGKLRSLLGKWSDFLFPSALLSEQCSAPLIADFNASVVDIKPGCRVADLTFGLGMDAFAFAHHGAEVEAVDSNPLAVSCGNLNIAMMGLNIRLTCGDAAQWLQQAVTDGCIFDIIFVDPARRSDSGSRLYNLDECSPDIRELAQLASQAAPQMLVKASPMLDVDAVMRAYPQVQNIWCVGLKGECKELLLHFRFDNSKRDRRVTCVDIAADGQTTFLPDTWPLPLRRSKVYELMPTEGMIVSLPTAAMVKARVYGAIGRRWPELRNVTSGTPLYLSESVPDGFPGRSFVIETIYGSIRQARNDLKGQPANTAICGYPAGAEALRQKLELRPLSDNSRFLIGCMVEKKKLLLWCRAAT